MGPCSMMCKYCCVIEIVWQGEDLTFSLFTPLSLITSFCSSLRRDGAVAFEANWKSMHTSKLKDVGCKFICNESVRLSKTWFFVCSSNTSWAIYLKIVVKISITFLFSITVPTTPSSSWHPSIDSLKNVQWVNQPACEICCNSAGDITAPQMTNKE